MWQSGHALAAHKWLRLRAMCAAAAIATATAAPAAAAGGLVAQEPTKPRRRSGGSPVVVIEDIQKRVAVAGGNTEGVVVASLSWATPDDLDLHVSVPGGAEISYRNRKADGGALDVDMCVNGRRNKGHNHCAERPVENVVFADFAPAGRYKVYVQNFNFHQNFLAEDLQVARMQNGGARANKEEQELRLGKNRPVLFEVLVKVEGSYKLFQGLCTPAGKTHEASNVPVFEFDYVPSAKNEEDRLVLKYEASSNNSACSEYEQKLLGSGAEGGALPGPGGASLDTKRRAGGDVRARPASSASPPPRKQAKPAAKSGRKAKAEEARLAALTAVRATSRSTLMSKPGKALRALLGDMGASCRGCMDKVDFVDHLLREAGVSDEL